MPTPQTTSFFLPPEDHYLVLLHTNSTSQWEPDPAPARQQLQQQAGTGHGRPDGPSAETEPEHALRVPRRRAGHWTRWEADKLRFIQAQKPLYRFSFYLPHAYRDPTVPTTQYNGLCHTVRAVSTTVTSHYCITLTLLGSTIKLSDLNLLSPSSGCPLQAGSGHGRPGRAPGRC